MFQNHAAAAAALAKKKKSVEGVAKDRGAEENNQPSPSSVELVNSLYLTHNGIGWIKKSAILQTRS